jgi:hypothetical protein
MTTRDANVDERKATDDRNVSIHINGQQFFITSPVTGEELRRLGHIQEQNQLFMERPGQDPDLLIEPGRSYEVKPGTHFYDLPRGTVGGR